MMQLFPFSDRQKTQSDLSIHRPSMLRFVLTPLTIQERCRIVRDQLKQLQYEHGQLLSLTGEQNGNENMEELQVEPGYELPRQLAEEKPTKEPKVGEKERGRGRTSVPESPARYAHAREEDVSLQSRAGDRNLRAPSWTAIPWNVEHQDPSLRTTNWQWNACERVEK